MRVCPCQIYNASLGISDCEMPTILYRERFRARRSRNCEVALSKTDCSGERQRAPSIIRVLRRATTPQPMLGDYYVQESVLSTAGLYDPMNVQYSITPELSTYRLHVNSVCEKETRIIYSAMVTCQGSTRFKLHGGLVALC